MKASTQQFSNAEVVRARFLCLDPLAQEGLVANVPEGAELRRLENIYELPKSLAKIRCAACGRTIHRKGFTGQLVSGERVLLGSTCGGETFGAWQVAHREFEELRGRQYYLVMLNELRLTEQEIWTEIEAWKVAAEHFDETTWDLMNAVPDLYSALRRVARGNGQLSYERTIQRRVLNRNGIRSTTVHEPVNLGPLPGRAAIELDTASANVERAEKALKALFARDTSPEAVTSASVLSDEKRAVEAAVSTLRAVHAGLVGLPDLFSARALQQIVDWARLAGVKGSYAVTAARIGNEDSDDTVGLATGYTVPSAQLLELVGPFVPKRSIKAAA
jgi:hypothetical protein